MKDRKAEPEGLTCDDLPHIYYTDSYPTPSHTDSYPTPSHTAAHLYVSLIILMALGRSTGRPLRKVNCRPPPLPAPPSEYWEDPPAAPPPPPAREAAAAWALETKLWGA